MTVLDAVLIIGLSVMVALHLAVFLHYVRTVKARTEKTYRAALAYAIRLTTPTLMGGGEDAHRSVVSENDRQIELSFVGGAISLAAWTQLYVSSGQSPGNRLGGLTLGLLFTGAVVLIVAPVFFRSPPRHITFLGRQSGIYLGLNMISLSLCGAIGDVLGNEWWIVAAALAVLIVAREVAAAGGTMLVMEESEVPVVVQQSDSPVEADPTAAVPAPDRIAETDTTGGLEEPEPPQGRSSVAEDVLSRSRREQTQSRDASNKE